MSYRLIIKPSAEKELDHLPRATAKRVADRLAELQDNPKPIGAVKLAGGQTTYRVRVGDYRIVYEVDDAGRTVFVTIIAHRRICIGGCEMVGQSGRRIGRSQAAHNIYR